jgi:Mor family transcriptional regulator
MTILNGNNRDLVNNLFKRLDREIGETSATSIISMIIDELGGCRITIPTRKQRECEHRNRLIRCKFTGFNCRELGIRFGLSEMQVRRIVKRIG